VSSVPSIKASHELIAYTASPKLKHITVGMFSPHFCTVINPLHASSNGNEIHVQIVHVFALTTE
jgi:hypothetical protein